MRVSASKRRAVRAAISALLMAFLWAGCALAQQAPPAPSGDAQPPQSPHSGDIWERDVLTGDWGGIRTDWESHGIQLGANYISEVLGNLTGGVHRGATYDGRLELFLTVDLEKAAGWSGATFHVNAYETHGRGLSTDNLGNNLLTVSSVEASRTMRLFDLWLEQQLWDNLVAVRIGQLAADDEFIVSQYGSLFINSTFGWPAITATDLPSGGPADPLGIR